MEPETFVTSAGQPETSAEDARRQRQREKQARYRAKKRQAGDGDGSPGDASPSPRPAPPNRPHVTRDPGATGHDADADEIAQWVTRLVDDRLQAFLGDAMPPRDDGDESPTATTTVTGREDSWLPSDDGGPDFCVVAPTAPSTGTAVATLLAPLLVSMAPRLASIAARAVVDVCAAKATGYWSAVRGLVPGYRLPAAVPEQPPTSQQQHPLPPLVGNGHHGASSGRRQETRNQHASPPSSTGAASPCTPPAVGQGGSQAEGGGE